MSSYESISSILLERLLFLILVLNCLIDDRLDEEVCELVWHWHEF